MSLKCLKCGSKKLSLIEFVRETLSTPLINDKPDYDLSEITKSDNFDSYIECQDCYTSYSYDYEDDDETIKIEGEV